MFFNGQIAVGGGSSGSVVASRLSEDPSVKVLLLEAGPDPPYVASIPALGTFLQKSGYDWKYETVPQDNACLALVDRVRIFYEIQLLLICCFKFEQRYFVNGIFFIKYLILFL